MAEVNRRILGMLGFAMRAGKLIIGTELICRAMPNMGKNSVKLVVISAYASEATKKKLSCKCEFYKIPSVQIDIKTEELGSLLGKTYAPACIGITDVGFAREIEKASN